MSKRVILRIKNKLDNMGLHINPMVFIYMRLISCLILFTVTFFASDYGYIVSPTLTILYYVLVEYIILDVGIERHRKELEKDALEFFPLFLIHLNGIKNVKKAIYYTSNIIDNNLSEEFKRVLNNAEIGKSLEESLEQLKKIIPSENIKTIIVSIIEANRVGSKTDEAISLQLNYIEENRRKNILNNIKTIPLKIALISIIFVFTILTIIIAINMYLI